MLNFPDSIDLGLGELLKWLGQARAPVLDPSLIHESYLLFHPRTVFLKTLPEGAVCFDVGAGSGSLPIFRSWPGLVRNDLRFVGVSLAQPEDPARYEEFKICNVDEGLPTFDLRPDAAVLAHFIEHIRDRISFLAKLSEMIPAGGRIYLEWPSFHSQTLPRLADVRACGYDLMTINFFDDVTHLQPIRAERLAIELAEAGFRPDTGGMIDMPYLADRLRDGGIALKDPYYLTVAVWLKTHFSSYFTATRI